MGTVIEQALWITHKKYFLCEKIELMISMEMWDCPKWNVIICQMSYKPRAMRSYLVLGSKTPLYRGH